LQTIPGDDEMADMYEAVQMVSIAMCMSCKCEIWTNIWRRFCRITVSLDMKYQIFQELWVYQFCYA